MFGCLGASLSYPANLINQRVGGAKTSYTSDDDSYSSSSDSSVSPLTVDGVQTFGQVAAGALITAQDAIDHIASPQTQALIGFGLAALRGGPIGAIGGYAMNQAVSATLSAADLDKQVEKLVTAVGTEGFSILDDRALADEQTAAAQDNGAYEGLLVKAGATILGIASLGGLIGKINFGNRIPTIGGRLPINSKYAGQVHPSGVRFTNQGFPNFKPYAQAQVKLKGLTGIYATDAQLANQAMGYPGTPQGYVWHHVEDGVTMQLIPRSVHSSVPHTGGGAVIRNGGFD